MPSDDHASGDLIPKPTLDGDVEAALDEFRDIMEHHGVDPHKWFPIAATLRAHITAQQAALDEARGEGMLSDLVDAACRHSGDIDAMGVTVAFREIIRTATQGGDHA